MVFENQRSTFVGVQVGNRRFSEHAKSIMAQQSARAKGRPEPQPFYAQPGCGTPTNRNEPIVYLNELQFAFPKEQFTQYR